MSKKVMVLSCILVITLFGMMFGGCKESNTTETSISKDKKSDQTVKTAAVTPEPEFKFGETPFSFSFFAKIDNYPEREWGNDTATQWISEHKHVTVHMLPSGADADETLAKLLETDSLPDFIWGTRDFDVESLRSKGKLVPLDEYVDKYPNLRRWAGNGVLEMLRSEDGHLYQFPAGYSLLPQGSGGYLVNLKMYRELGSPKLETFDDLYRYLLQVKEKYSKQGVIPLEIGSDLQGIQLLYSGFADDHPGQYLLQKSVPNGDELSSIFTDTVFKETMQFVATLSRDGLLGQGGHLLNSGSLSDPGQHTNSAVIASTDTAEWAGQHAEDLNKLDANTGYAVFWPFHKEGVDKNKVRVSQYSELGTHTGVITTHASNPEAIFAYLDWLTGEEGQRTLLWGPQGLYWQSADDLGVPNLSDMSLANRANISKYSNVWGAFQWAANTGFMNQAKTSTELKLPEEQRDQTMLAQMNVTWKTAANITLFEGVIPAPETEEGQIFDSIHNIYNKTLTKVFKAMSDEEVEALLLSAEQEAKTSGYEKLLEYETGIWQGNLEKSSE